MAVPIALDATRTLAYDVFVSYAPQDGNWVNGVLLPAVDRRF